MNLRTTSFCLRLISCVSGVLLVSDAFAQDGVITRRVDTKGVGTATEVIINQVDTSAYPKVTIFATVLRGGQPVIGLDDKDFRVREDEVDQEPLTVVPKLTALNAVVTIDTSGSIKKALPQIQAAAKDFIDLLHPEDKFNIISFARQVQMLSESADRAAAKGAIDKTSARGDTALYDALYESVNVLKDKPGRKAVILLTDGVDDDGRGGQLSKHSLEEALELARTVNLPIFTIGLGSEKDVATLERMAKDSGGIYFDAPSAEQLKSVYDSIGKQLSGQYNIYYTSNLPADGTVHQVALAHSGVTSIKEYTAPESEAAVTASNVVTSTITEKVDLVISNAPGLHIAALLVEGGEPILFEQATVIRAAASNFDQEKKVDHCYNKKSCSFTLEEGGYIVEVRKDAATVRKEVQVIAGQANNIVVVLNAGLLNVVAIPAENAAPIEVEQIGVVAGKEGAFDQAKQITRCYNKRECSFTVPAGKHLVQAKKGSASASEEIAVKAGEIYNISLMLSAGQLNVVATLSEGGEVVKAERISVLKEPANAFDQQKTLDACYQKDRCSFTVSAGDVVVEAERGAAVARKAVKIVPGAANNTTVVLNAGVLNVVATSAGSPVKAESFKVIQAAKSAFDEPKTVGTCYQKERCAFTLPTGKYQLKAEKGAASVDKDIEIKEGQALNIEIQLVQ